MKEAAAISMGTDISESDILNILALCEQARRGPSPVHACPGLCPGSCLRVVQNQAHGCEACYDSDPTDWLQLTALLYRHINVVARLDENIDTMAPAGTGCGAVRVPGAAVRLPEEPHGGHRPESDGPGRRAGRRAPHRTRGLAAEPGQVPGEARLIRISAALAPLAAGTRDAQQSRRARSVAARSPQQSESVVRPCSVFSI